MWTGPWRVIKQSLNSYKLEMLEGELLRGDYSSRRLRRFVLREGTELAAQQKAFEIVLREESQVMGVDEGLELTSRSDEHGEVDNEEGDMEIDQEEGELMGEESGQ